MSRKEPVKVPEWIAGMVVIAGMGVFVRGVWLAWRPGGWIMAGLLIAIPALFFLYDKIRPREK
jgi:hypothetical protein